MSRKSKVLLVVGSGICGLLAFGIWNFVRARATTAALSRCEYNLQVIEISKRNWQSVYHKPTDYTPSWDDLRDEFRPYAERYGWTNGLPTCRDGGTYKIGRLGERPTCSIGGSGHSLP